MKLWQQFKAWIIPFVLAVLAVSAVNKARTRKKQANRAKAVIEQHTEHDIDELAVDVQANVESHKQAQKAAKEANRNAKKRIEAFGSSNEDMDAMLDQYRRRFVRDSADFT